MVIVNKDNLESLIDDSLFLQGIQPPKIIWFVKAISHFQVDNGKTVKYAKPNDLVVKFEDGSIDLFTEEEFKERFRPFGGSIRVIK